MDAQLAWQRTSPAPGVSGPRFTAWAPPQGNNSPCQIAFSGGAYNNALLATLQERVTNAHGRHGQAAVPHWMHMVCTPPRATGGRPAVDMTKSGTYWHRPPARREWLLSLNRAGPLKRTLQDLFVEYTGLMFASLRVMAGNCGWASRLCPLSPCNKPILNDSPRALQGRSR